MSGSAAERDVQRNIESVKLGMSLEDVGRILGIPDETCHVPFGGQTLTGWLYRTDSKPIQIWFDENGKLRLKNVR
jgi:hypothetical protein